MRHLCGSKWDFWDSVLSGEHTGFVAACAPVPGGRATGTARKALLISAN